MVDQGFVFELQVYKRWPYFMDTYFTLHEQKQNFKMKIDVSRIVLTRKTYLLG